ncbi:MAG: hypothetical protein PHW63_05695 [Alphaproteobacteria bacterium]|nr:hypothetical protein [Alphaproteobacteria bacterium]
MDREIIIEIVWVVSCVGSFLLGMFVSRATFFDDMIISIKTPRPKPKTNPEPPTT